MKRLIVLLLALTFIVGSFAACKKGNDESKNTDGATTEAATTDPEKELSELEKRALVKDNLPDDLDFDGREFKTFSFYEMYDIDVEGTDGVGNIVTDSIYVRNRSVENRLNVNITNVKSTVAKFSDFSEEIRVLGEMGDTSYHSIITMGNAAIQMNNINAFQDIDNLTYISANADWWWSEAMEEVSFDIHHQKFLIGDICLSGYTRSGAVLVNLTDYNNKFVDEGIQSLYDLVAEGNWTVEELKVRAVAAGIDVGGDGLKFSDSGDYIGLFVGHNEMIKFLEYGFDVKRYSRDEDGCVILDYDVNRASTAVDALIDLLFESEEGVYWQEKYHKTSDFAEGRTLFQMTWVSDLLAPEMRAMEDIYTMVPVPKLDTAQTEYKTNIQNSAQMAGVLKSITDVDFVSAVLEALCTESYRKVVLPFYETALKSLYAKDAGVRQMIDIITASASKNFLYEVQPGGGCGTLITSVVLTENNLIVSEFDTQGPSTVNYLAKLKEQLYPTPAA